MILVARFAATAVLNYAMGIALAWLLVPAEFGVVSVIQNVFLLAAGLLTAGLPWALAIRIAQTHGETEAAKPEFRTALIVNAGFGLLLGAAFTGAQLSGHRLVPTDSVLLDLIVAAELPLLAVNSVLGGVAQGSRRFNGLGTMQTAEILLKCVTAVFAVAVFQAGAAGVALSFLIGTMGSVLIGLRTARGLLPGWGPLASLSFLYASGSIWFASASITFLITADLLGLQVAGVAAGVSGAVLAGYQACSLLARASFYVSDALADAIFPFMAKSRTSQERHGWFVAAARWVPAVIIPVQLALCIAPEPVLSLFLPAHYSSAQALLRVLAAGTLGTLMANMLTKGLFAVGWGSGVGRRMPVALVVETACLATLVPRYGAIGAALSCLAASYVSVALLLPLYLRGLRVRLLPPGLAVTYIAWLAPVALLFAMADWFPALAWVFIIGGMGLSLLTARRNRLITDSDVRVLRDLRARLRDHAAMVRPALRASPLGSLRGEWRLAAFSICTAAVALGCNLFNSPDVLYDEAAYTLAAQKVAQAWHLTLDNRPLFVHPPLMFLVQAGWLRLTGHASVALPSAIHAARLLAASAGGVNVLLIAAFAYRLAGGATSRQRRMAAVAAAVLAAFDPVLVRYDRQDVIEPFALCISLLVLHAAWQLRGRGCLPYASVTGLLGGLALLTNEITAFLIVVPLIFAVLERDRRLIGGAAAALAISAGFLLLFFAWSVELGLAASFVDIQTATLRRLIGIVQITGLNVPGAPLLTSLRRSVTQYAASYIVLASGFAALAWCWSRRNTQSGNFLTAWLTASYGLAIYIAAIGTLNEQFFVYVVPASIVGSVLFANARITRPARRAAHGRSRHRRPARRLSRATWLTVGVCVAGLSTANWFIDYTSPSNAVLLMDNFIAARLPRCAVVNASGDAEKYSDMLGGRRFALFYVGPTALAYGVHYFVLSTNDVTEREGNMSPGLASWIQDHGQRLAVFPSQVYGSVQLWHVPASAHDPSADITDIAGGFFANTAGSDCGGYSVTNGNQGSFYTGYQALGGKAVIGRPLSQVTAYQRDSREQLFDGAVLTTSTGPSPAVAALPLVAMLAQRRPAAYRRAALPPVVAHATAAERRGWLTSPSITRAYLDGTADSPASYAAAIARYGEPLGPPSAIPGGQIGQAFADVVLQVPKNGGTVHAAPVTSVALAAGLIQVPAAARPPQQPPPLPDPPPLGKPEPTSARPFAFTLAAALPFYWSVVGVLASRQRRHQQAATASRQWVKDAA